MQFERLVLLFLIVTHTSPRPPQPPRLSQVVLHARLADGTLLEEEHDYS